MEPRKILLLEDETPLRKILVEKFKFEGFSVVEAETGEQAIDLALKEKPELIVTDLIMFPMDGVTFLKRIRDGSVWGARVPCIVFSNQKEPEPLQEVKTLGVEAILNKAETPLDDLVVAVRKALDK